MMSEVKRPFYQWSPAQNEVWRTLYDRQWYRVQDRTHSWHLDGHKILGITSDKIPEGESLSQIFQKQIDWELISTDVQYSDGQSWFEHLSKRQFLITEYIRDMDSLDYTPLPDIFHDVFGHLPVQINQRYADLTQTYANLMLQCPPDARQGLGSIWWYSIEFGLMKEQGELKAFGTGLMSSYGEFDLAFSDKMERRPFDPEDIAQHKPSPHEMHKILWVMENFEQLEEFVANECQKYGVS